VEAVGADVALPLTGFGMGSSLELEGRSIPDGEKPFVTCSIVNDNYFRALGIPLKRGRAFTPSDREGAPGVVVVNERFARTFFRDNDPVGQRIKCGFGSEGWQTIVGVVGDVRQHGLAKETPPIAYLSYLQAGHFHMSFVVRARGDPGKLAGTVRAVIAAVDPTQPVYDMMTLEQRLAGSLAWRRFTTSLMSVFSVLAMGLAALGIYGVIAYSVAQRTHEIGIRIALGPQRGNVLGLVLRQGLWLALVGVGLGLVGGLALTRLIAGQLYGVKPSDPITFLCAVVSLLTVASLACLIPALRATRVDPIVALRHE
jgi:putative ABC transport system permease protein